MKMMIFSSVFYDDENFVKKVKFIKFINHDFCKICDWGGTVEESSGRKSQKEVISGEPPVRTFFTMRFFLKKSIKNEIFMKKSIVFLQAKKH